MIEAAALDKVKENDPCIGNYLSTWEEITVFYNDDMLMETHAYEFFIADLQAIRNNGVL